ncbi:hypothetical protein CDL15_Pgr016869 [Punica granatum]|uniref:Uncharacterized protein n=1 Tax=Punica granatum TaxID=22663 RepID=A0A218WZI0_PUNGR|nr:hypothetical protein CDL15_Pgr016869 [Punica granatum]
MEECLVTLSGLVRWEPASCFDMHPKKEVIPEIVWGWVLLAHVSLHDKRLPWMEACLETLSGLVRWEPASCFDMHPKKEVIPEIVWGWVLLAHVSLHDKRLPWMEACLETLSGLVRWEPASCFDMHPKKEVIPEIVWGWVLLAHVSLHDKRLPWMEACLETLSGLVRWEPASCFDMHPKKEVIPEIVWGWVLLAHVSLHDKRLPWMEACLETLSGLVRWEPASCFDMHPKKEVIPEIVWGWVLLAHVSLHDKRLPWMEACLETLSGLVRWEPASCFDMHPKKEVIPEIVWDSVL